VVVAQQEDSYRVQGEGGVWRGEGSAAGARARRAGQGSCAAVVDGVGTARLASLFSSCALSQKSYFRFAVLGIFMSVPYFFFQLLEQLDIDFTEFQKS